MPILLRAVVPLLFATLCVTAPVTVRAQSAQDQPSEETWNSIRGDIFKDRPILEAAAAARCSHLVTSDRRDFGAFFGKSIMGVKILSPQMMADELGLPPSKPKGKR